MNNRIALCIGISSYKDNGIDELPNAVSDANLVHQSLTARGFDSELIVDATYDDIEAALERLKAKGDPATRAFTVIYFAGHGFETGGLGFLLPIDFPGPVELLRIPQLGMSSLRLVDAISEKIGPKLIILDACRLDATRESPASEITRFHELAEAIKDQYSSVVNADDVVFAFATSAGAPAGDGVNGNSRYCEALASGILSHDHSLDELLAGVAQQVIRQSQMGQRPWYLSSLTHSLSFSDLPTLIPIPFEVYRSGSHQLVTRLHSLNASRVAYSIEHEIIFAERQERRSVVKFKENIQAIGSLGSELYVLLESGVLMHGDSNFGGKIQFKEVHRIAFKDVFAISISPSGRNIIIVGMAGYEVIGLVGREWSQQAKYENPKIDFYNAKFFDDDSAVLCGSRGTVCELTGLSSSSTKLASKFAQIESSGVIQDIEIVDGGKFFVVVYSGGYVKFFDRSTLALVRTFSLNDLTLNLAHGYASLRNQFTRAQVELYFRDRAAFASRYSNAPDFLESVDALVGHQQLLCCSLMKDTRVLAIASEEGYVFLIDVRDQKHFRTIDVGGGHGKTLRWMCADLDSNALVILLSDGVMVRYEGLMPQH
ncbi:caspase family protein [Comamonas testosteroni]|uniref:Caspase family p20 domain-containing protein n=1 Tax=Comamonas testosteroni TaxID=285 RepID=A0A096FC34_COMTE|nr:caspase family protein [Comamonas testosteroni]KGH27936.1 hypothetical protein P353_16880 [Comamonas testosteroni]